MSDIRILIQFKNSLIEFIDELIDQFPQEPDLIILRIFLQDQIPIEDVISKFILAINKNNQEMKKFISDRNEKFFLESDVFESIAKTKSINFKKLWLSGNLDDEEKENVWKWIDSFVKISELYTKAKNKTPN
jgi:hypothetical protein